MIKAVFFDLDGTLLPMDTDEFAKKYCFALAQFASKRYGYDPKDFIDFLMTTTFKVMKNQGPMLNSELFYDAYQKRYGKADMEDAKKGFDEYYSTEFLKLSSIVEDNPEARRVVDALKEKGIRCVLATNPLFPTIATNVRMGFVGLKPEDFEYVSYYENSCLCKPNPEYFRDIMGKLNLKPEEVIMVGNHAREDGDCAIEAGIKHVLLIDKYLMDEEKAKYKHKTIPMDRLVDELMSIVG